MSSRICCTYLRLSRRERNVDYKSCAKPTEMDPIFMQGSPLG